MSEIVEEQNQRREATTGQKVIGRSVLFAAIFLFWLLMVWPVGPVDGSPLWGDVAIGLVVAAAIALLPRETFAPHYGRLLQPERYLWALIYLFVFAYYVVKANVDVAYRVLHPAMPIRPGIVRARTKLRTASARTLLANCITLTPGTLTIDITEDGTLYIHWINVTSVDEEEATKAIVGRFEWFIEKIFEWRQ